MPDKKSKNSGGKTTAKADNSAKSKSAKTPTNVPSSALPMFYQTVVAINSEVHRDLTLSPSKNLAFAKSASSIVLAASEFAEAAMHYPIVFGRIENQLRAFAVTGHTNGENLFIDKKNQWRVDTYIPAYVRRYPFVLIESEDKKTMSLGADIDSEMLKGSGGQAIYDDGQPSQTAQRALDFCVSYHRELKSSETVFKQIDESGILIDRSAEVTLQDDKKVSITGFSIVDEGALAKLDDEQFIALRKSGALTILYCQL